jgi:hypothetical protein
VGLTAPPAAQIAADFLIIFWLGPANTCVRTS